MALEDQEEAEPLLKKASAHQRHLQTQLEKAHSKVDEHAESLVRAQTAVAEATRILAPPAKSSAVVATTSSEREFLIPDEDLFAMDGALFEVGTRTSAGMGRSACQRTRGKHSF